MTLTEQDVTRMERLARLAVAPEHQADVVNGLNHIFGLIEKLQVVDTAGVEPLAHPLSAIEEVELRLREDVVTESASVEARESLMANAPARENGLFLVPKVLE